MRIRTLGVVMAAAFAACSQDVGQVSTAIKVEVVQTDAGYRLIRGGEPYAIKGAGLEFGDMESFAAHGGNSIRNWTTKNDIETAQEVLDRAHALGITVSLCLPMQAERWGFDYNDDAVVAAQLEAFRKEVLRYRNHPALLTWIIGNELNYNYTNSKVYDAVNDVSKMIHDLDPNHPTTSTVVGLGENVINDLRTRATDLDFFSFQVYGELFVLPDLVHAVNLVEPFMITEWGAVGHWEVDKTSWGAPIEATSSEKAETYMRGYREMLQPLEGQLIGSYVFIWGQKQERTPTWFGLFTEAGEETETVDVMHHIWNDAWPANRSPTVQTVTIDGKVPSENVTLTQGEVAGAAVDMVDADGDSIMYRWELKRESETIKVGGDFEESIASLEGLIDDASKARIRMTAPAPGAYRLFVYAYDGQGHAAHANIPYLVVRNPE